MKIGILTYHRAHNYGAMLQAYALRIVLQKNGHQAEFIDYWPQSHQVQYKLLRPIRGKGIIDKIKNFIADILTFTRRYWRSKQFNQFAMSYLSLSKHIAYPTERPTIMEKYDLVIVGSDQIWRNHITTQQHIGFDPVYFCQNFACPTHCISYAASMGIINLCEQDRKELQHYLNYFGTILVRENSLKSLINQLTFQADVVLDPTLLITKEEWNTLLPSSSYRKKQYVLYYELIPSTNALAFAREQARTLHCDLLIMDSVIHTIPRLGHISYASPIEFLHAIRDAKYVVATSFHGTAFSIIFEKQFITIGLRTNSDRVQTLLKHLQIENNYSPTPAIAPAIDYTIINTLLEKMRQHSLQLLTSAINISRSSKEK